MKHAAFLLAVCVSGTIHLLAGCVGDNAVTPSTVPADAGNTNDSSVGTPTAGDDGGSTVEAGSDAATSKLPLIDSYTIAKVAWAGTSIADQADCVNRIDTAAKGMGSGFVAASGTSTFGRYADRHGALVVGACTDASMVMLVEAWAVKPTTETSADSERFKNLALGVTAGAASVENTALPKITAGQRIVQLTGALPLSTCQNRAKAALAKVMGDAPASPNKWSDTLSDFGATAGTDGSSGAISCINNDGQAVIDVLTIDPEIAVTPMLDAIEAALRAAS